jgi:nicotinamidase-related amidase
MPTDNALVIIDFINEIVNTKGKLAGKGYANFIEKNDTAQKLASLQLKARSAGWVICHVGIGFDPTYLSHPENSPLFGAAKKFGALNDSGWGCEFAEYSSPQSGDFIIRKRRVSAFFGTDLDTVLRSNGIANAFIAGCATDLAVQSAARDAHDRDYNVTVVEDACAAANDEDHVTSLPMLRKIAKVAQLSEL